ncbi:antibiotic biosynthesis monooxygenase [Pseudomonas sp. N3-W]|uniref:putative quinol monooxygenase n=1 Tax=Pseudomonas sp. N3-W TaxID=2975049 RepID=UPI00217CD792|nr:antibiotic biosynthesis monooxygenase [Pseudomonas sp. N3-W]UWF47227.1 antibiotic biosynthesis monooxygenase [Pseudomonas sp. N3-W]
MSLAAINTIEIHPISGQSTALQSQLNELLETLRDTPGCTAYTLTCSTSPKVPWIITGHWHSTEHMQAHFNLPCLARFFELTTQHLASSLQLRTFIAH